MQAVARLRAHGRVRQPRAQRFHSPLSFGLGILPVCLGGIIVTLDKGTGSRPPLSVLTGPSPGLFAVSALTSVIIAASALLTWLASIALAVRMDESRDL